jgi:hypothetical protein
LAPEQQELLMEENFCHAYALRWILLISQLHRLTIAGGNFQERHRRRLRLRSLMISLSSTATSSAMALYAPHHTCQQPSKDL